MEGWGSAWLFFRDCASVHTLLPLHLYTEQREDGRGPLLTGDDIELGIRKVVVGRLIMLIYMPCQNISLLYLDLSL